MTPPIFEEKQSMIKTWGGKIVLLLGLVFVVLFIRQLTINAQMTTSTWTSYGVFLFSILGLIWLFSKATLTTHLSKEGITVHYPPFVKKKHFAWTSIDKVYTRHYKPIGEFGGWGLRNNGSSLAYNVAGNFGLQLEFQERKNILIGSQKQEELETFIRYLRDEKILSEK